MKRTKKPRRTERTLFVVFAIGLLLVVGAYYLTTSDKQATPEAITSSDPSTRPEPSEPRKTGELIIFSGAEFRDLYNSFAYPNTEYIADNSVITGDPETDAHIQKVAEARGYLKRSAPVSDAFRIVESGMSLQQRASEDWQKLKNSAKTAGLIFGLTAAYRSSTEQLAIFRERFGIASKSLSDIEAGVYDAQLNNVLRTTAIPGYSRHHTGYTVDIACKNQPNVAFEFSNCFAWLSADNYKNAKLHGWIPSYPEGAGEQGPDPEAWEYVWVGLDAVTK